MGADGTELMAQRPIFLPLELDRELVEVRNVSFGWSSGMSLQQKQRSVDSLHDAARTAGVHPVLEISSKSRAEFGRSLSAFTLMLKPAGSSQALSVECAFQGSKVFQRGGPYQDLYRARSIDAKRDERLKTSGDVIAFRFFDEEWPTEPKTAFYNWLYVSALAQQPQLSATLSKYAAFSDIEFNPEKSFNCQAHAAALFVSLKKRGLVEEALQSKEAFLRILGGGGYHQINEQPSLF